jgi:hypothetical protein
MTTSIRVPLLASAAVLSGAAWACWDDGYDDDGYGYAYCQGYDCPSNSEVAVSLTSGALNNNSGSHVALAPRSKKSSVVERTLRFLQPEGTALAASWTCTGPSLSPAFEGLSGNPYAYTPPSCRVAWLNGASGATATSTWSGPFVLDYGESCDAVHASFEQQAGGCEVTRTTSSSGNTRTITGPDGNTYVINHDTNGAGTGWDSSVSPAPTNRGVLGTCASTGCVAGGTLVVHGSPLTGSVTVGGGGKQIWDHTVSTDAVGLTVTGGAGGRVVNGSITVQHNLEKYTSISTFDTVVYGDADCCFPTSGSVTTMFTKGKYEGQTERIDFGGGCGETTFAGVGGTTSALTLSQCL